MARNPNLCHPPKTTPILRRVDKGVYAPLPLDDGPKEEQAFLTGDLAKEAPPTPKRRKAR